ncbi:NAD(P)/FAD-dependent oxidoreductase [Azospira sp. I09]|uniref:NAD(P)/FAD-dependent oxidoreductase n=1 Tax=Azospira sp. I09 TaxID=1765049 RepID=UPI001260D504|nr:NAD(P)/FAD-dependent oxidoreductase [Azospira sp. I09]BBN87833.1 dehydrogenase [Azospira sp. I09]
MTERTGAVVIGAGVVGLACARELARRGIDTVMVEKNAAFGQETSARNSEVIHAGLYYPSGSHKAALCLRGRELLYAFCRTHQVAHRACGKLIVATSTAQEAGLDALQRQGEANGVTDLRRLDAAQARALEPALSCSAALLSPATGIVDSHGFMLALLGEAESAGAALALRSPFRGARRHGGLWRISIGGEAPLELDAAILINAAGLHATQVAAGIEGLAPTAIPPAHYAKGNYYSLAGRAPFSRLVYPLPEPGGLGVHLTLDLGGQARFGPDVEWLATRDPQALDYRVDPRRADAFYAEVRRYWPQLADNALQPAYSGVRPKISGPGAAAADFCLQGPEQHGLAGLINLFGIESPGLTASLAIAEAVAAELPGLH